MAGKFHEFGEFVDSVAALPRVVILTMHNVSLRLAEDDDGQSKLILQGQVKTYRYVDEAGGQAEQGGNAAP